MMTHCRMAKSFSVKLGANRCCAILKNLQKLLQYSSSSGMLDPISSGKPRAKSHICDATKLSLHEGNPNII